jgi:hypothetical protein
VNPEQFQPGDRVRHVKSGSDYEVIASATMEATLAEVIVYRSLDGGRVWVRPAAEFCDGRFTALAG